jgi:coenzyme F420-reducing hydrogenase delta subunit
VGHTAKILEEIGLGKDRVRRFVMENRPEQDLRQDFSGWVEKVRNMDRRGKDPGGQISNSPHG